MGNWDIVSMRFSRIIVLLTSAIGFDLTSWRYGLGCMIRSSVGWLFSLSAQDPEERLGLYLHQDQERSNQNLKKII